MCVCICVQGLVTRAQCMEQGVVIVTMCVCVCVCTCTGGVLFPGRVSISDRGGSDAHQTGAGEGRAGEVPAVQGRLQRPEEGKGQSSPAVTHNRHTVLHTSIYYTYTQLTVFSLIYSIPCDVFFMFSHMQSLKMTRGGPRANSTLLMYSDDRVAVHGECPFSSHAVFSPSQLCFCCRTKRFSFFTWSYTCQFCKR